MEIDDIFDFVCTQKKQNGIKTIINCRKKKLLKYPQSTFIGDEYLHISNYNDIYGDLSDDDEDKITLVFGWSYFMYDYHMFENTDGYNKIILEYISFDEPNVTNIGKYIKSNKKLLRYIMYNICHIPNCEDVFMGLKGFFDYTVNEDSYLKESIKSNILKKIGDKIIMDEAEIFDDYTGCCDVDKLCEIITNIKDKDVLDFLNMLYMYDDFESGITGTTFIDIIYIEPTNDTILSYYKKMLDGKHVYEHYNILKNIMFVHNDTQKYINSMVYNVKEKLQFIENTYGFLQHKIHCNNNTISVYKSICI